MGTDKRDLVVLATQIAESLVATALQRLLADAHAAGGRVLTAVPAVPARRALPPAPFRRRGRKPGPKPGRRRGRPRKTAGLESRRPAPAGPSGALDLATRHCRKCHKLGTAKRVAGSERTVRCENCGTVWDIRLKRNESGGKSSADDTRRRGGKHQPKVCVRCDHDADQHDAGTGRCLVPRCVCAEFYE